MLIAALAIAAHTTVSAASLAPAGWDANESKFAHPFHLHGFFFLPLDEKLEPIHPMAWKDTLNVPIDGTVRFIVVFDERPGGTGRVASFSRSGR